MHIDANAPATQMMECLGTVERGLRKFQPHDIEMTSITAVAPSYKRTHMRHVREGRVVEGSNLLPLRNPARQPFELGKAECALNIGQAVVIAELDHVIGERADAFASAVIRIDTVIAKAPHVLGNLGVISQAHPAFARRDVLHRVEGKARYIRESARRASLIRRTWRVARVGDEAQSVSAA